MTSDKVWSFAIALAAVAGAIAILAVFSHDYPLTPATVPTHFGVTGAPDAYGPRSTFVIFPVLGGVLAALAVIVWASGLRRGQGSRRCRRSCRRSPSSFSPRRRG